MGKRKWVSYIAVAGLKYHEQRVAGMLENYLSQNWEITSQLHTRSREGCELEEGSVNWKEGV